MKHYDIWGDRNTKYDTLLKNQFGTLSFQNLQKVSPYYFFVPHNITGRDEYEKGWKLSDLMRINTTGIVTARDGFVIDFEEQSLLSRIEDFRNKENTDDLIRARYFEGKGASKYADGDSRGWKLPKARLKVQSDEKWRNHITQILYRPFDERKIYYVPWMVDWGRWDVMTHIISGRNLAFITTRQTKDEWHILATRSLIGHKALAAYDINSIFPLYLYPTEKDKQFGVTSRYPNFSDEFIEEFSNKLGLEFAAAGENADAAPEDADTFTPEAVFHYAYAVFHSPTYRARYAEFLKIDFPRLPLTTDRQLFRKLCAHGKQLVNLHLLESVDAPLGWKLITEGASLFQTDEADVAPGFPKKDLAEIDETGNGKVYINKMSYFRDIPEEVWNFHIGGYQVCHKWLKDRKDRELSEEDINHYGKIVVALGGTIRLMAEIDETIEEHGGFPLVGSQKEYGKKNRNESR